MTAIVDLVAREILDSRGNPTVEVDVILEDGSMGRAAVPSGASTGAHEAVELRDGGKRYLGKGVSKAVDNVVTVIQDAIIGMDAEDQAAIDETLIELDGTKKQEEARRERHPRRLARRREGGGGGAGLPLYRYVGGAAARVLPVPMMNIVNGGAHADNPSTSRSSWSCRRGRRASRKACAWARRCSTR